MVPPHSIFSLGLVSGTVLRKKGSFFFLFLFSFNSSFYLIILDSFERTGCLALN
jgi:hypothetical protein